MTLETRVRSVSPTRQVSHHDDANVRCEKKNHSKKIDRTKFQVVSRSPYRPGRASDDFRVLSKSNEIGVEFDADERVEFAVLIWSRNQSREFNANGLHEHGFIDWKNVHGDYAEQQSIKL